MTVVSDCCTTANTLFCFKLAKCFGVWVFYFAFCYVFLLQGSRFDIDGLDDDHLTELTSQHSKGSHSCSGDRGFTCRCP